jgi:hypothetical protein
MMQSSSTQTPVPQMPDSSSASGQQVAPGHITKLGGTEVVVGCLLLGVGILTISATALLDSPGGIRPSGGKVPALYAGGASASAVGVTLIAFGLHRRSAK